MCYSTKELEAAEALLFIFSNKISTIQEADYDNDTEIPATVDISSVSVDVIGAIYTKENPSQRKVLVDQGTQTDESIERSLSDHKKLSNGLYDLENAVTNLYQQFQEIIKDQDVEISDDESDDDSEEWLLSPRLKVEPAANLSEARLQRSTSHLADNSASFVPQTASTRPEPRARPPQRGLKSRVARVRGTARRALLRNNSSEEMVALGKGYTKVPKRKLMLINWDTYSGATRRLLLDVFPRSVLATHCMTGKQSPAFLNKPAKKCLDPRVVEDIVLTVMERCGVPEHLVRKCITSKCADEAKMRRNRLKNYRGRPISESDQENISPSTTDTSFNKEI